MTLTQTATYTKTAIIILILLGIFGTSGAVGYSIYLQYKSAHTPKVEEPPEMKFGNLPAPIFPQSQVSSSNFYYSLDTTTGGLPEMPRLIRVYFIPQSGISLLAPEKAKQLAESLGFKNGPEILPEGSYKFSDGSGGNLNLDLATSNFHFQKIATSTAQINLPDQTQLVASFKEFLLSKNLLPEELKEGEGRVTFSSTNSQDSDSATVSIKPADFDKLPIVFASFKEGLVKGIFTKAEKEEDKFNKLDYTFWTIDKTTSSTYPLKTTKEAFDDLRSGKGYISLEPEKPQVSISAVYLAYFETMEYSPYLQPVFVFEGPDFAALIPAIKSAN